MGDVNPPEPQTQPAQSPRANPFANLHLKPDVSWIVTIPGILAIVEVVLALIVIICAGNADNQTKPYIYYGGGGFILFTAIIALIVGIIRIVAYLLNIPGQTEQFMWVWQGLVYYVVWTIFYFISGAVAIEGAVRYNKYASFTYPGVAYVSNYQSAYNAGKEGFGAAAFFCWLATLVYLFHAFLFFLGWRNGAKQEVLPIAVPERFAPKQQQQQTQSDLQQPRHQIP